MIELITYGHHLTKEKFKPVDQCWFTENINKPKGGVWSSPVDSHRSWKDWALNNSFMKNSLSISTTFSIRDDLKLFILSTVSDYEKLMEKFGKQGNFSNFFFDYPVVDFKKLAESEYRGLWLTEEGLYNLNTHNLSHSKGLSSFMELGFHAWDVETILLFHWEDLQDIKHYENDICLPTLKLGEPLRT